MNHNNTASTSPLDTRKGVMAHLKLSVMDKPLSVDQKIQILRDLMSGELGAGNALFHDCCEEMIIQLHRLTPAALPLRVPGMNAVNFLADPLVLEALMVEYLENVADRNVAFRVSCIEELGRIGRVDILLRHVGHVRHWKEGQALLRTLIYVASPNQIFDVLQRFIRARFFDEGSSRFGADIYREESMDGLVNAVVAHSDLTMLRQLNDEFRKGWRLLRLHPEQFDRYDSQITAALVACEVRADLAGLIRLTGRSHPGHAESAAFPVMDLGGFTGAGRPLVPAVGVETSATSEPTRILPRPTGLTPPPDSALSAPVDPVTGSLPLPPRGSHADDESFAFTPEDVGGDGTIGG